MTPRMSFGQFLATLIATTCLLNTTILTVAVVRGADLGVAAALAILAGLPGPVLVTLAVLGFGAFGLIGLGVVCVLGDMVAPDACHCDRPAPREPRLGKLDGPERSLRPFEPIRDTRGRGQGDRGVLS